MTITMTASEVKARILSLLDQVAEGEEIEITKHGRPVARLISARGPHALKGKLSDVALSASKEDDLFTTGVDWELP